MYISLLINLYFWQSSKWKFEFTGLNQILEFILYKCLNKNWTIYWSWARGPVLILSEDWHLLLNQNFLHYLASIFIWIINLFYSGIISPLFGALVHVYTNNSFVKVLFLRCSEHSYIPITVLLRYHFSVVRSTRIY